MGDISRRILVMVCSMEYMSIYMSKRSPILIGLGLLHIGGLLYNTILFYVATLSLKRVRSRHWLHHLGRRPATFIAKERNFHNCKISKSWPTSPQRIDLRHKNQQSEKRFLTTIFIAKSFRSCSCLQKVLGLSDTLDKDATRHSTARMFLL